MAAPDARFERLRAVAATSNIRSPLARFFSAHHDQFVTLLSEFRPRWDALVEQWAAEGLLTLPPEWNSADEQIRSVTRQKVVKAARRTWERVKVKKAGRKTKTATEPTTQTTAPVKIHQAAADRPAQAYTDLDAPPPDDDVPKIVLKNVTLPK